MYLMYKYVKRKRQEKREQQEEVEEERQRQAVGASGLASNINGVPVSRDGIVAGEPLQPDDAYGAVTATTAAPAEQALPEKTLPEKTLPEKKKKKPAKAKPTPEEKAEKKARYVYRFKIIIGLMMPFTLQGLDTTIVASALPFIADDFGEY